MCLSSKKKKKKKGKIGYFVLFIILFFLHPVTHMSAKKKKIPQQFIFT